MTLIYILSLLTVTGVFIPETKSDYWLIRSQDYIKTIYALLSLLLIGLFFAFSDFSIIDIVFIIVLAIAGAYCLILILPFTTFWNKKIATASQSSDSPLQFFIFNVLQDNDRYEDTIKLIQSRNPDIVLLMETCHKWDAAMGPLREEYKYEKKAIQENKYGMLFLSRIPFNEAIVNYVVSKDIPSLEVSLIVNDRAVRVFCLHPRPPILGEADYATNKDKEVVRTAKKIAQDFKDTDCILMGDLNDVAWSKASIIFKKLTGMQDPRVGRGFYATFPSYSPLKIPIDQVFCSPTLKLKEFEVLEDIGSDHLPIFISLQR